eukprot:5015060-Pleurochrysis_carterae.AAC.4
MTGHRRHCSHLRGRATGGPLVTTKKPMREAVAHTRTPILAHLEAHWSLLPRKGRRDTKTPHLHDDEEVCIVLDGGAHFRTEAKLFDELNATRGTFVYYPSMIEHSMAMRSETLQYLCIRFFSHDALRALKALLAAGGNEKHLAVAPRERLSFDEPPGAPLTAPAVFIPHKASAPPATSGPDAPLLPERRVFVHAATAGLQLLHVHSTAMQPGKAKQSHADATHDIIIVVLQGAVTLLPRGDVLQANDVAVLPAGSNHGLRNDGPDCSLHYAIEFHGNPIASQKRTLLL